MQIVITNLVKEYGAYRAVDHLDLTVPGGMFGLLGPNGAGKTSLMRILTTTLAPTSGKVFLGEIDLLKEPGKARQHLGYLPYRVVLERLAGAMAQSDVVLMGSLLALLLGVGLFRQAGRLAVGGEGAWN